MLEDFKKYMIKNKINKIHSNITENKEESTITINYSKQVGNLNIKVIDAETKENLSNAEITIYDSFGNIVYRINTTSSEINVTLPVGDYTVKQTITPPNY